VKKTARTFCSLAVGLVAATILRAEGYRTSLGTPPDGFPVVVVAGTPYQMGRSLGALMKPEIQAFAPRFLAGAQQARGDALSSVRLDEAWRTMEPFMSARFKEELRGLAESSGLTLDLMQRAHMVPVISEYSCSGVAVWGPATRTGHLYQRVLGNSKCRPLIPLGKTRVSENPGKWRCLFPYFAEAHKSRVRCCFRWFSPYRFYAGSQGRRRECDFPRGSHSRIGTYGEFPNTLYQIRNLDYSTDAHLQDYPCVVIYIPSDGIPHLNPSFAGSIGCHTGMNTEGIALTEIGDSPGSDKPYDLHGLHFMFMFRDILSTARTLDQAVQMIKDTKRIKKYHFIVGDGKLPAAVKMKAWAPDLAIWKDNDPADEMAPQVFPNVVCHAESRTPTALGHLSEYAHGRYDADAMIQLSAALGSLGGNLMNAVYDATTREAWLSYAEKNEYAYRRPYVRVNLMDFIPYNPANPKAKIERVVP